MFFNDKKDKSNEGPLTVTTVPSPVSEALILICEKCGKKLASGDDQNPSREIQLALKEKIKSAGAKGQLRAAVTSCIDICPKDEIAVAILHPSGSAVQNEFITLKGSLEGAADQLFQLARATKK